MGGVDLRDQKYMLVIQQEESKSAELGKKYQCC
jgi:hypothetical protein